jgi:hypothetical protein
MTPASEATVRYTQDESSDFAVSGAGVAPGVAVDGGLGSPSFLACSPVAMDAGAARSGGDWEARREHRRRQHAHEHGERAKRSGEEIVSRGAILASEDRLRDPRPRGVGTSTLDYEALAGSACGWRISLMRTQKLSLSTSTSPRATGRSFT